MCFQTFLDGGTEVFDQGICFPKINTQGWRAVKTHVHMYAAAYFSFIILYSGCTQPWLQKGITWACYLALIGLKGGARAQVLFPVPPRV